MNEPQSIAAEKIAFSILAGTNPATGCQIATPGDFIPISVAGSALWPPATSVSILNTFTVPKGQALIWTYISLYTTLADESTAAVNYGFNFNALAQIQFRSGASGSSNFVNVTGQVQSQAIFNKPCLFVFDSDTLPRIVLYPNGSTQTANSLLALAEFQGYLIPAGIASAIRVHASRVS